MRLGFWKAPPNEYSDETLRAMKNENKMRLEAFGYRAELSKPYRLSFGTLDAFDTVYLAVSGSGRIGVGEITPLPGYNEETIEQVWTTLRQLPLGRECALFELEEAVASVPESMPSVASGLACALETWFTGTENSFSTAIPTSIPLALLCDAKTPDGMEKEAARLVKEGAVCLKIKITTFPVDEEVARIKAASSAIDPSKVSIRLDANQGMNEEAALALCRGLSGLPIAHLEQPFASDAWDAHRRLTENATIKLMLDESIVHAPDLDRAVAVGACAVKMKLCKHPGMASARELMEKAMGMGLEVVFGNGVQTEIGNHLEARVYSDVGLKTAAEFNGFAKISKPAFTHLLRVSNGMFLDEGITGLEDALKCMSPGEAP